VFRIRNANILGDSCSRRNPEDLGLILSLIPFYVALRIKEISPLNRSHLRERRRILLEFSSSRKVDNSRTAAVRGKPRIRSTIYYIINFEYVIHAVYECMKNTRVWARLCGDFHREIRWVTPFFFYSNFDTCNITMCSVPVLIVQRFN